MNDNATCKELGITEVWISGPSEKFQPFTFHTFDLPPISVKIIPTGDEKFSDVCEKARRHIEAETQKNFELQFDNYIKHVKLSQEKKSAK